MYLAFYLLVRAMNLIIETRFERVIKSAIDHLVLMIDLFGRVCVMIWKRRTEVSLVYLMILTHTIVFKAVRGDEIAVIKPLLCDKFLPSDYLNAENCFRSCDILGNTGAIKDITIYQQEAEHPIALLECEKVRSSVTYTQTWTFSKFKIEHPDTYLSPLKEECWKTLANHCKNQSCEVGRPVFADSYVYAADNVKVIDWIKIRYHLVDLPILIRGEPYIRIEGKLVTYKTGSWPSDNTEHKIFLWSVREDLVCSTKPAKTYQCNVVMEGGQDKVFVCGKGSLIITPSSKVDMGLCNNDNTLEISREGMLFSRRGVTGIVKDGMPIYQEAAADAVKAAITQARAHILLSEEGECRTNCIQFNLRSSPHLSLYGKRYVARDHNNKTRECVEDGTCHVLHPFKTCKRNNLIEIVCSGRRYWWNPSSLVIFPESRCIEGSKEADHISILTNGGLYIINGTGVYFKGGIEIQPQFHKPGLYDSLMWIDKEQIRNTYLSDYNLRFHDNVTSSDQIKRESFDLGILQWVENIQHEIKAGIIFVVTGIAGIIGLYLFLSSKNNNYRSSGPYELVNMRRL